MLFLFRLPYCFSICIDSEKKILPLCCKHVITISSRKIREEFNEPVFSEVCLKHLKVIKCLR